MHAEAWAYVKRNIDALNTNGVRVLEWGARDINGSPRGGFPDALYYVGVDVAPGPGVDVIANAATFKYDGDFDFVICMEVFEHTPEWREIIVNARRHMKDDGFFIMTAAGHGRPAHSAIDGRQLAVHEHTSSRFAITPTVEFYENLEQKPLEVALVKAGFEDFRIEVNPNPGDIYAIATVAGVLPA